MEEKCPIGKFFANVLRLNAIEKLENCEDRLQNDMGWR